jgi:hypothetical protein
VDPTYRLDFGSKDYKARVHFLVLTLKPIDALPHSQGQHKKARVSGFLEHDSIAKHAGMVDGLSERDIDAVLDYLLSSQAPVCKPHSRSSATLVGSKYLRQLGNW